MLTVNDFAETLNKGDQSDVVFLDFSKAYLITTYFISFITMVSVEIY